MVKKNPLAEQLKNCKSVEGKSRVQQNFYIPKHGWVNIQDLMKKVQSWEEFCAEEVHNRCHHFIKLEAKTM